MKIIEEFKLDSIFSHESKMVYNYVLYNTSVKFTEYGKTVLGTNRNKLLFKVTISKIKEKNHVTSKYLASAQKVTKDKIIEIAKRNTNDVNILQQLQEELNHLNISKEVAEEKEMVIIAG